jgi:hypothetical protein
MAESRNEATVQNCACSRIPMMETGPKGMQWLAMHVAMEFQWKEADAADPRAGAMARRPGAKPGATPAGPAAERT